MSNQLFTVEFNAEGQVCGNGTISSRFEPGTSEFLNEMRERAAWVPKTRRFVVTAIYSDGTATVVFNQLGTC